MWPALLFIYGAGVAVTALTVFRNRIFSRGYLVNAGAMVLWPVYWSLFLTSYLLSRTPSGPGRPSK